MEAQHRQDVSITAQRSKLSNSLKNNGTSLVIEPNAFYYIIATSWIIMFKEYISFDTDNVSTTDNVGDGAKHLFPGPIDNSNIADPEDPDLLRKGIEEGQDYSILPKEDYDYLKSIYGDNDIRFLRTGLRISDGYSGSYTIVDLRPYKIRVWTCDEDGNIKNDYSNSNNDKSDDSLQTIHYVSSRATVGDLHQLHKGPARLWLRITKEPSYASRFGDNKRDIKVDFKIIDKISSFSTSSSSSSSGMWRILIESEEQNLSDLVSDYCGNLDIRIIDLLVEKPLHNGYQLTTNQGLTYPRDSLLAQWKTRLQVGDILDFRHDDVKHDCSKHDEIIWYEGIIVDISKHEETGHEKGVYVRRLGFKDSNKTRFFIKLNTPCLAPLYSKSNDWREPLVTDDEIEMHVSTNDDGEHIWEVGTISSYNRHTMTIDASYKTASPSSCPSKIHNKEIPIYSEQICQLGTHFKNHTKSSGISGSVLANGTITNGHVSNLSTLSTNGGGKSSVYGGSSSSSVTTKNKYSSGHYGWGHERRHIPGKPHSVNGTVGLVNLGNTCFMASMLQCMSNTKEFSDIFIDDEYKPWLNRTSVLSFQGKLAEAYAELIKDLWGGKYSSCAPVDLKRVISERHQQFAGYQQQDSQEFLNFLLDGLHEDLNRIKKKPYIEEKDSDGRPEEVVAQEASENFKLRDDSIVVDKFYGQLKSHITCLKCGRESVKFDPISVLSLPIPVKSTKTVEAIFFRLPYGSPAQTIAFEMPATATLQTFKDTLLESKFAGTKEYQFATVSKYGSSSSRIDKNLEETQLLLDSLRYASLMVYEVLPKTKPKKSHVSHYYNRTYNKNSNIEEEEEKDKEVEYDYYTVDVVMTEIPPQVYSSIASYPKLFGLPTRLCLPIVRSAGSDESNQEGEKKVTNKYVYDQVKASTSKFMKSSKLATEQPSYYYTLCTTNQYGTQVYGEIPENEEEFELQPNACLSIAWTKEGRDIDKFDGTHLTPAPVTSDSSQADENDSSSSGNGSINLYQCLDKFSEKEKLGDTETIYCSKCKEHLAPSKKLDLWNTPDVLIIHLKRFQYIPGQFFTHREKITDIVDFPIENLDLSNYIGGNMEGRTPIYDLFGVSQHSGSMNGGHYTAICKNFDDQEWYCFNDSIVSPAKEDDIVTPEAYVLFYRRRHSVIVTGIASLSPTCQSSNDDDEDDAIDSNAVGGVHGEDKASVDIVSACKQGLSKGSIASSGINGTSSNKMDSYDFYY